MKSVYIVLLMSFIFIVSGCSSDNEELKERLKDDGYQCYNTAESEEVTCSMDENLGITSYPGNYKLHKKSRINLTKMVAYEEVSLENSTPYSKTDYSFSYDLEDDQMIVTVMYVSNDHLKHTYDIDFEIDYSNNSEIRIIKKNETSTLDEHKLIEFSNTAVDIADEIRTKWINYLD